MHPLILDCETTTFQKGHVYSSSNKLCYVGIKSQTYESQFKFEYDDTPYGQSLHDLISIINNHDLLVGFNTKFDISWTRRYGIKLPQHMRMWDLQAGEFIIGGQETPFADLDGTCARRGINGKTGDIAEKYWNQGIDTPEIPELELVNYVRNDCQIEWDLFNWQWEYLADKPLMKRLIWNVSQDILITAEMEWNGIKLDIAKSQMEGDKLLEEISTIDASLNEIYGRSDLNWNSNDHLSVVLYGGTIIWDRQVPFTFNYKDGRTTSKLRWTKVPEVFARLCDPLKGTDLKKAGFYGVDEGVLKKLKATGKARQIINLMLERNSIEKACSTYYHGFPKLYEKMRWQDGIIHGQLNHARAKTGRLASSKPNQQNLDQGIRECIVTRF